MNDSETLTTVQVSCIGTYMTVQICTSTWVQPKSWREIGELFLVQNLGCPMIAKFSPHRNHQCLHNQCWPRGKWTEVQWSKFKTPLACPGWLTWLSMDKKIKAISTNYVLSCHCGIDIEDQARQGMRTQTHTYTTIPMSIFQEYLALHSIRWNKIYIWWRKFFRFQAVGLRCRPFFSTGPGWVLKHIILTLEIFFHRT